jgi:hypothetical protein
LETLQQLPALRQLVHAVCGLDPIPDEALPMSREIAQVADRWRRNEARADEPMREKVRDPLAVLHVDLPAWHGLDVVRIGQDYLETPLEKLLVKNAAIASLNDEHSARV